MIFGCVQYEGDRCGNDYERSQEMSAAFRKSPAHETNPRLAPRRRESPTRPRSMRNAAMPMRRTGMVHRESTIAPVPFPVEESRNEPPNRNNDTCGIVMTARPAEDRQPTRAERLSRPRRERLEVNREGGFTREPTHRREHGRHCGDASDAAAAVIHCQASTVEAANSPGAGRLQVREIFWPRAPPSDF